MIITAPERLLSLEGFNKYKIFLAGTIDMGNSVDWQSEIISRLSSNDKLMLMNPRRPDWDSSWVQDISNKQFNEQVTWELDHLDVADLVVFWFGDGSQSPITLMELGIMANSDCNIIVRSTPKFWRHGNIQMVCDRFGIDLVSTMEEMVSSINALLPEEVRA